MIKKYKTNFRDNKIALVDVIRETDKSVFVPDGYRKRERREAKKSEYGSYFDSWEEAHAFILNKAEIRLKSARLSLQDAQGNYGNIKGMRKPNELD